MPPSPDHDPLTALIQRAAQEGVRASQQTAQRAAQARTRAPTPWLAGWALLMLLALGGAAASLWTQWAPVSDRTVAGDLEQLLLQARQSVEAARERSGRLPDALPQAALGTLVRYQVDGAGYTLSARLHGMQGTLGREGSPKIEKGVQP